MKVTVTITRVYDGEFDDIITEGHDNDLSDDLIHESIIDAVLEETSFFFRGADWKIEEEK